MKRSRPDSPIPVGVNSRDGFQTPHPSANDSNDDDLRDNKDKDLYTTFSFQDNEMSISIDETTKLAKFDSGSDLLIGKSTSCGHQCQNILTALQPS